MDDILRKKSKSVTLYYRRATWDFQDDHHSTLEDLLKSAHRKLKKASDRTFKISDENRVSGVAIDHSDGFFAHVVLYRPNASTSTVPNNLSTNNSEISEEPAPKDSDYVNAAVFVLVIKNHVIVCPNKTRDGTALRYFYKILKKVDSHSQVNNLKLEKIANTDVIRMIKEQGVSELVLDSSLYEASIQRIDSSTPKMVGVLGGVANYIKSAMKKDTKLNDIEKDESVNVKVSLKFDKRGENANKKKTKEYGNNGRKRLKEGALQLFESEESEGFRIKTFGGNTISAGKIGISDKFDIAISGNTLCKNSALESLKEYYQRLEKDGILEQ